MAPTGSGRSSTSLPSWRLSRNGSGAAAFSTSAGERMATRTSAVFTPTGSTRSV